ncbi:Uncharacterised protein [Vibrio cholerae]|nr:Uncharacterised protein [Vibrio cholerae]CSB32990.1 Uncharacterised protein [Vibrio cholerae]CSB70806.1 Uncharacterised protein [Vibrio cholerae]CSB86627.1 Uncharacterised protein [Vibrio cholerae]CSB90232.1 Uncharacterised protein [Vibrio cholerae]
MQDRYEDFVKRHTKHGGFIGRTPCIGAVINRLITHGHMSDSEHMMALNLVVITRVVTIRTFICKFVRIDIAFEHDFSTCGHFQIVTDRLDHFSTTATQQSSKRVFR